MRFLLIDRITNWEPGKRASAIKNVSLTEDFFVDHFPLKPIMPGVLIIEGMAQLSGILIEEGVRAESGRNVKALMSIVERAKFRKPCYPGDTLIYDAKVISINELGAQARVEARVQDVLVAESSLTFSFHEIDNARLEQHRTDVLSVWLRGLDGNAGI